MRYNGIQTQPKSYIKPVLPAQHRNKTIEVTKCTQKFDRIHQNLNTLSNLTQSHFDLFCTLVFRKRNTSNIRHQRRLCTFVQNKSLLQLQLSRYFGYSLKFYHFYIVVFYYNTMQPSPRTKYSTHVPLNIHFRLIFHYPIKLNHRS